MALIFYLIICACLASALSALLARLPSSTEYGWRQEAHDILGLPFDEVPPPSFTHGRSQCPKCQQTLSARDLIPLISYLVNKGRCRFCHQPIAWTYLALEVLFPLLCLPLFWYSNSLVSLGLLTMVMWSLAAIALFDARHQWIPDILNLILLGLTLTLSLTGSSVTLVEATLGMMFGYGFFALVRLFYLQVRKLEAIGLGDAKLMAGLGSWLGVSQLPMMVLYASLLGIAFVLLRGIKRHEPIPFGPFLVLGALISYWIPIVI